MAPTRRARVVAIVVAALVLVLLASSQSVVGAGRADAVGPRKSASAWLPYWDLHRAYRRVVSNADLFGTASPFWYDAACTGVSGHPGAGNRAVIGGLHRHRIKVVPTVTSAGLTPTTAIRCLGSPGTRRRHVAALVGLSRSRAYDGIDINYEHLALTTSPARALRVRRVFTVFVEQLCPALRRAGKTCIVTVMPRRSDRPAVWRSKLMPAVYDYARIAAAADRMRVMGYDQHASGTRPGPVAGYPWVSAVTRYATSVAPADKLELGIPLYGRDWVGRQATSLTAAGAVAQARQRGVRPRLHARQRETTYRYRSGGRRHTVWTSSSRAVGARVGLARRHGLAGVAFWAPGMEAPRTWPAVRARLRS
ncbi:MAG TPA: glycosyl hydrolase family 18 protein [Nocardioidaceae bacterium]|nr:glycosyl hydrolase family 18 protein [Nocardioidaceae bacterium]